MADYIEYGDTVDVWVQDGHVYVARPDGITLRMTPEVAIAIGRKLESAGTGSFINKVMDGNAVSKDFPHDRG
jgi:hypothetical protein